MSLSFVRSPDEVRTLKDIIRSKGSAARVIAKIEKREALDRLEEIVAESDGIMVARGDLGVEIDVAEMPLAQKRIIRTCQRIWQARDHCHANARQHARIAAAHAGRGDRRGQRHSWTGPMPACSRARPPSESTRAWQSKP